MTTEIFDKKYPLLDSLICYKGNNWEDDEDKIKLLGEQYSAFIESKARMFPNIQLYLDSRLHDSWVQSIEFNGFDLIISLNEFSTHCFSDALSEKFSLNIPHKKRIFPVCLRFQEIKHYSISWLNRNGKILALSKEKYVPKLSEFLYDQATVLETGDIRIGFLFWSRIKGNKSYLLLQIESKDFQIEEFQRQAFLNLYGERHIKLFDTFWKEKQKGVYFDFSSALDFINKN